MQNVASITKIAGYQLDGSLFDLEKDTCQIATKRLCEHFGLRLIAFVLERDGRGNFFVKAPSAVVLPRRKQVEGTLSIGLHSEKKHWELITNLRDPQSQFDHLIHKNNLWVLKPDSVFEILNGHK